MWHTEVWGHWKEGKNRHLEIQTTHHKFQINYFWLACVKSVWHIIIYMSMFQPLNYGVKCPSWCFTPKNCGHYVTMVCIEMSLLYDIYIQMKLVNCICYLTYTTFQRDCLDADLLSATLFDVDPSHRRPVSMQID